MEVHRFSRRLARVRMFLPDHLALYLHPAHGGGFLSGLRIPGGRHPSFPTGLLRDPNRLLLVARL